MNVTKISDELEDISKLLTKQTGEKIFPSIDSIFECFKKHCYVDGYGNHIWDDKFISAFEIAQDFLIENGKISEKNCMRT